MHMLPETILTGRNACIRTGALLSKTHRGMYYNKQYENNDEKE